MITAMDFDSGRIRATFRNPQRPERLSLYSEPAEYALVQNSDQHRRTLEEQKIACAVCEGALAVVGNQAAKARWLSRVPCAPLMPDGLVPSDDPPARQLLHMLVSAILPRPGAGPNLCGVALSGMSDSSDELTQSQEFLCRLVHMAGYEPLPYSPAEAAMLAVGSECSFTGISVVMGAETTEICVSRLGKSLAGISLKVGSNWVDNEIARQFRIYAWDTDGACYLDPENVRSWEKSNEVNLRHPMGERERTLAKLYTVMLDRVACAVVELLQQRQVAAGLPNQRLSVLLSGGGVGISGFATLLTERLIEHQIADRINAVRVADQPETAAVRGALIAAELDSRARRQESVAA